MKCGACGGGYAKISANLFGCATARNKGTCDNRLNIRTDTLETIVFDGLKHRLMAPDLFKEFATAFVAERNAIAAQQTGKADEAKSELVRIKTRLKVLVNAVAEGLAARSVAAKDEAFSIIRTLIGEVRLVLEEGKLRVERRGALAWILALAQGNNKSRLR